MSRSHVHENTDNPADDVEKIQQVAHCIEIARQGWEAFVGNSKKNATLGSPRVIGPLVPVIGMHYALGVSAAARAGQKLVVCANVPCRCDTCTKAILGVASTGRFHVVLQPKARPFKLIR